MLGSGDVGRLLAEGIHRHRVAEVVIGTRRTDDEALNAWATEHGVRVLASSEAVAWADTVIFGPKVRAIGAELHVPRGWGATGLAPQGLGCHGPRSAEGVREGLVLP